MSQSADELPTRQTLLKRLKNSEDHESWQDFFNLYWKLIYSVAIRAGLSDVEAQEVVQETVISVSKKIGDYKADPMFGSFKSWLLLITRRRIADQFRKRPRFPQRHKNYDVETSQTATINRIPDPASLDLNAVWEEQWEKNLVDVAIERVKEQAGAKDYLLFYQNVVKKWPVAKVAEQYNVSRAHVYVAKYRISKLIKHEVRNLQKKLN